LNTASLQIEGLLVALAAVARALADGDAARQRLLESALAEAEQAVMRDSGQNSRLSRSQMDAVAFPIRYLATAIRPEAQALSFAEVTMTVARAKPHPPAGG
jgi:hypothetical protein